MYQQESNEQYSRLATFMEAEEVMEREELKRLAGYRAAEYVVDGTVVGLGTGSTTAYTIEALGARAVPRLGPHCPRRGAPGSG